MVNRKELLLFVLFYVLSTLIYYTATWITWGGLEKGHYSFFDLEEFFAAAATDFIISFFITIPIWYITVIHLKNYSLKVRLSTHFFFLPLYLLISYYLQYWVKDFFGWAMFWGGKKVVWTFYNLMLFYMVQFAIIHAYNFFKQYKKEEQEKFELRELALKSEMLALKSQLNPHFLHNLFNSINATVPPENERTRELIVQLSDLFRYQNYASQKEFVTLQEELAFIESYLQLMKLRLKERLTYSFEISPQLLDYKIIPMLLQPLIENAIIHGISPKQEPSNLIVRVTKRAEKIHFSIEDTGIGFSDKKNYLEKGLGLSNSKLRLNKLYETDLIIEDNMPSGTKISFTI